MPDYIYLLENRLSLGQQNALKVVREAAREAQMTVFLTGGAVRDLTSGSPVRDLDFSVQGNALKLKKTLEKAGGVFTGEEEASHTLFFRFGGGARAEIGSTRRVEYPKPGKPVYEFASIHEDLRRRDFTANAMALSLNEGSYGLLMDPLNGVADIESRLLRLVSNYGFLEQPSLLIRATRFAARMGWEFEEKTLTRFENAKAENIIGSLSNWHRGYELEEIGHEEDALRILKVMEDAGWMAHLYPAWTTSKADVAGLDQLREVLNQLQVQGVNPDTSTASMTLLTAKMTPHELAELKKLFVRPGFVAEWNSLDAQAKEFAQTLTSKQVATPSATWKLLTTSSPEAVLWLGFTSKSAAVQEKYRNFSSVWPESRQKIPYTLMQEMRITPSLDGYQDLVQSLFFELIDGRLETEEQIRAFLEPFSPPAPPPPVTVRRTRGKKASEAKAKARAEEAADGEDSEDLQDGEEKSHLDDELDEHEPLDDEESDSKTAPKAAKHAKAESKGPEKPAKSVTKPTPAAKTAAPAKAAPKQPAKAVGTKATAVKAPPEKTVAAHVQPAKKAAKPIAKHPAPAAKKGAKPAAKPAANKVAAKPAGHAGQAKASSAKAPSKPAAKKKAPVKASKPKVAAKPVKAVQKKPTHPPAKAAKKKH